MKFGITEAGDASLDYSWKDKMDSLDGAIIITKNLTDKLIDEILNYKEKIILHATCTGYGGTILEPNIPEYKKQLDQVKKLIYHGFPREQIVIRIDPVIPTEKGVGNIRKIVEYIQEDVKRYRISVIDMYPHVRERFKISGLPVLFGGNFQASKEEFKNLDKELKELKDKYQISFESCAEGNLQEAAPTGCVSKNDIDVLKLSLVDESLKGQRKTCLCLSCKTELLTHKGHKDGYGCEYKCLYCYWK